MAKGKLQVFFDEEIGFSATLRVNDNPLIPYVLRIRTPNGHMVYIGGFRSALEAKEFLENYDPDFRWHTVRGYIDN